MGLGVSCLVYSVCRFIKDGNDEMQKTSPDSILEKSRSLQNCLEMCSTDKRFSVKNYIERFKTKGPFYLFTYLILLVVR